MDRLFSPWRSRYIASFSEQNKQSEECLFCRAARERKDRQNLVLLRRRHCFVMMNLYPYNSGHLLVVPYTHTPGLDGLTSRDRGELIDTVSHMIGVLEKTIGPHGFNVGANLGRIAGAGIDQHVHLHIVPRWNGDTNFMPTVADVKMVSESLESSYKKIRRLLRT